MSDERLGLLRRWWETGQREYHMGWEEPRYGGRAAHEAQGICGAYANDGEYHVEGEGEIATRHGGWRVPTLPPHLCRNCARICRNVADESEGQR